MALLLAAGTIVVASVARLNLSSAVFGGVLVLLVAGVLTGVAAWLLGMIQAARMSRWDWFVEVLVLGPLGALIFGLAAPSNASEAPAQSAVTRSTGSPA